MKLVERLYDRYPSLRLARRNLTRNRVRSLLAGLGIVIGVFAIASLGIFGNTLRVSATGSLGDIGDEVMVSPAFQSGVETIDDRTLEKIQRAAPDSRVVGVRSDTRVVEQGDNRRVVTVYGTSEPAVLFTASAGRIPTRFRRGALAGARVSEAMDLRVGNTITVDGENYRVRVVLEEESGFTPVSPNNAVVIPERDFEEDGYSLAVVQTPGGTASQEVADNIREELNSREKVVDVTALSSITESISGFFDILNAFLIGIGSISLFVAGTSILNVMLMSAVERRKEVGVLRAVGARKSDVLKIFLVEAVLLGIVGGAVGVLLSASLGMIINQYLLQDALVTFSPVNLGYLLLGFGFGVLTSLGSGLYPAWKAANEHPVEALQG